MYAYNARTRDSHASRKFTVQSSKFSVHSSKFSMHPVKYICLAHAHVTCEFTIAMCRYVMCYMLCAMCYMNNFIFTALFEMFSHPLYKTDDTQAYFVDQWEWMHSLTLETV